MSAKYSTSPALHLIVGKSLARRCLHRAFCLCAFAALYFLYARGYLWLALGLIAPVCFGLFQLGRESMIGARVGWRQGTWSVERGGVMRPVEVLPVSTSLPWVVYLAWREQPGGRRDDLWLFGDCAAADQWRLLRVRLTLQR